MFRVFLSLAFSYLNFQELLTFAERLIEIFKRRFAGNEFIVSQLTMLEAACDKLMKAFQKCAGSAFTSQLAEKDTSRDKSFRSLVKYLDGMSAVESKPVLAGASQALLTIIDKHDRGLYRYGYARESAALYALEKELSLDSSAQLLADAGATELFEELKVKAREFEDLYQSKINDAGVKDYPLLSETARDITYRLNCLLTCGDAIAYDNQKEYDQGIRETNQAITDIMTPARARSTRQENSSAEEKKVAAAAMA
jgi:hypothetical protein